MVIIPTLIVFLIGTTVGSFLNVVAYRSVHGGSIFADRSKCRHCDRKLKARDLIPIFSYLLLSGNCRYCKKNISIQYPLVEILTGVIFAFTFVYWLTNLGAQPDLMAMANLAFLMFLVSVLIVLTTTDIVDGLLPNTIILPAIGFVIVYRVFLLATGVLSPFTFSVGIVASLLIAFLFFAIVLISKEKALGGGDIKLALFIGLFLGWPLVLVALFLGFLTGGLLAAMLILLGTKRFGQTMPLGPFLNLGAFIALFYGQQLIEIYLRAL